MAKGVLNPADKARKEARKKELKKNKKQRQQVRSAVIENINPEQVLADLEQLDRCEFDTEILKRQQHQQPAPNTSQPHVKTDLLYAEKRKRLKELLAKCLSHYEKEDPERHAKLKSLEDSYETKHKRIKRDFEAVKAAAEVSIDEVILPPEPVSVGSGPASEVPSKTTPPSHILPPQLVDSFLRGPPASSIPRQPFAGPRPSGAGSQEQQSRKRPRFVPRQARHPLPQPAVHAPGRSSDATTSKPAAGDGSSSLAPPPPAKPAVIESKPVIFMPKATKFVPASVRSRIRPAAPRTDAD